MTYSPTGAVTGGATGGVTDGFLATSGFRVVVTKLSVRENSGSGRPAATHSLIMSRVPVPMRSMYLVR